MTNRIAINLSEDRFHRHSLIPWWDQHRLASSTALVLGVGALGNEIIKNLCLLGVGRIRIVDLDVVENSNLSRSPLFRERHEGMPKAQAAAEAARELYPAVNAVWHKLDLVHDLGWGHVLDSDIVLAGLDGREARLSVNRACIRVGKLFFDGAIEGIAGVARVFDGRTGPCYECTMGERDWELMRHRRSCNMLSREQMATGHTPTVTTISSIVAALEVQQAVKHLHGLDVQAGCGLSINGIGFDATWFGIFVTVMCTIGLISPPTGMTVFVIQAQHPEIPVERIYLGTLPFLVADFVLVALLVAVPDIVMWLPRYFGM